MNPVIGFATAIIVMLMPGVAQSQSAAIDFASFSQRAVARLMAADTDKDGKVGREEFTNMTKARGARRGGGRLFARMDIDKDGALSQSELSGLLARRFARLDANHDGMLTADERRPMRDMSTDPEG